MPVEWERQRLPDGGFLWFWIRSKDSITLIWISEGAASEGRWYCIHSYISFYVYGTRKMTDIYQFLKKNKLKIKIKCTRVYINVISLESTYRKWERK